MRLCGGRERKRNQKYEASVFYRPKLFVNGLFEGADVTQIKTIPIRITDVLHFSILLVFIWVS